MNALQSKLINSPLRKLFALAYNYLGKCYMNQCYDDYRRKYKIANSFVFSGKDIILAGDGNIILGRHSYIRQHSFLTAVSGTTIKIGDDCKIAPDFYVSTSNYRSNQNFSTVNPAKSFGDVTIGDGCWIGQGVFVKEGVTIEEQCVVGAGSVVTRDLPAYSICAGVPARVIRFKESLSDILETIKLVKCNR